MYQGSSIYAITHAVTYAIIYIFKVFIYAIIYAIGFIGLIFSFNVIGLNYDLLNECRGEL